MKIANRETFERLKDDTLYFKLTDGALRLKGYAKGEHASWLLPLAAEQLAEIAAAGDPDQVYLILDGEDTRKIASRLTLNADAVQRIKKMYAALGALIQAGKEAQESGDVEFEKKLKMGAMGALDAIERAQ